MRYINLRLTYLLTYLLYSSLVSYKCKKNKAVVVLSTMHLSDMTFGKEPNQSCGPNHGQVVYRLMPRPVVAMLGELECWATFSPHVQRWLHVIS